MSHMDVHEVLHAVGWGKKMQSGTYIVLTRNGPWRFNDIVSLPNTQYNDVQCVLC